MKPIFFALTALFLLPAAFGETHIAKLNPPFQPNVWDPILNLGDTITVSTTENSDDLALEGLLSGKKWSGLARKQRPDRDLRPGVVTYLFELRVEGCAGERIMRFITEPLEGRIEYSVAGLQVSLKNPDGPSCELEVGERSFRTPYVHQK